MDLIFQDNKQLSCVEKTSGISFLNFIESFVTECITPAKPFLRGNFHNVNNWVYIISFQKENPHFSGSPK